MKKINKNKSGFTIIEVVLVLAIAGLIFMMVFIAYPALRRSQRDTQRQNDVSRLMTAIQNYQSNNRGALPKASAVYDTTGAYIRGHSKVGNEANGTWAYFYDNYLLVGSNGAADVFTDPDGTDYNLQIVDCENEGDKCTRQAADSFAKQAHNIMIITKAVCDGETVKPSNGDRNIAVAYKKEGGGAICQAL
jgi:prepilin-type N-terminal cleavage/methylation domain-containing protein